MEIKNTGSAIIAKHRHGETVLANLYFGSLYVCSKLYGHRAEDMTVVDSYETALCMVNAATAELAAYFAKEDSEEARASAIFARLSDACVGEMVEH